MPPRRTVSVAMKTDFSEPRRDIRALRDDLGKLKDATKASGKSLDELAAEAAVTGGRLDDMADEARQADRELDRMAEKAAKATRATEKLGAGVRISGRNLKDMKGELGRLDRQIDETIVHLKLLEHQFATTGDKSLLKQISSDRSLISKLKQIRKDLTPGSAPDFADLIGGMPFKVGSIAAIGVAASALAAPIGAAVAGAVIGGVGLGGIVGGVIAAAQDGRVKDAFKPIGEGLGESLKAAGQPFLGPLLHEASAIAVVAYRGINILRDGFAKLSPVLRPLVLGLDGFVGALGPGLSDAFRAAQPAIRALANELPEIGDALSDMFRTMAEDDRATEGLIGLLQTIELLTRATGEFIGFLEWEFDLLVKTGTKLNEFKNGPLGLLAANFGIGFEFLTDQAVDVDTAFDKAMDSSNDFAYSLDGTRDSADEAAAKLKEFNEQLEKQFDIIVSAEEAHIRLQRQWDDTIEVLKDGKRTLDISTKAGQDNKEALLQYIEAARAVYKSELEKTGSVKDATAAYEEHLNALRKAALALHFNKQEVDALIESVRSETLKKGVELAVRTPGLTTAQARLDKVQHTMDLLDGQVARATVLIQEQVREDARLYRRWGGVTEHAATGILRDPGIYSPQAPARYAFAEPATGGEAFVPRKGPYGRAMSILDHAAGWYGASVVPGGYGIRAGGGTQTVVHEHRHTVVIEGTGVMSGLRTEVNLLGGVQAALGPL